MRKRIIYVIIIVVLLLTGCTIGGSFYMLNFSLTPDAKILSKDADSYPYTTGVQLTITVYSAIISGVSSS